MSDIAGNRDRLDFLDVARGAAALLVLFEHGLHACLPGYLEFSRAHVITGQSAILVFFMVSGFVIPMSLEHGKSNAVFWLRRFFRLFPVYWFSILLGFAYTFAGLTPGIGVASSDVGAWLANLVLVQGLFHYPNIWGVFWTLPFEVLIYVVCSLLFACGLLQRIGTRFFAVLLVVAVCAGVGRPLLAGKPISIGGLRMVVLSSLFGLLAQRYIEGKLSRRALYELVLGFAAVVLLIWSVNHALFPELVPLGQLGRFACVWGIAFAFFLALLEARHRKMPYFACWLGRRSYPIYLLHPLALVLLSATGWPAWAFMPCLLGLTLALAASTHAYIERPGIALGRWLEKRFWTSAPTSAAIPLRRAA